MLFTQKHNPGPTSHLEQPCGRTSVVPLDVKKDRKKPVPSNTNTEAAGCGCSQHKGQTAPQHTPLHAPHAPPSAPRPATRRAKAPCTYTMDCRRSGTDGPTDSTLSRVPARQRVVGARWAADRQ
ncbi:hypothetical protein EMIHUDRAFT_446574 [Emiliania huxleyi CCMP1516]|uniref:Uncharacterized protein n=2 Tax=Emiliania huxleyi TaxID=2903 RepID=A0A0D3I374_EMIH1|nr:hypothetical protein EMIHUDRAFT_446574 [Emiliania huxleyi CCMP1516]EOD05709.1 hypothetical protein EMIHUDRAFT_446574 [Emiliania huxleyi CCMP1516]|eukprot:XP_005758138.1 hypothetical protein EMIHUDRAFT_446574 [Emiliania huxleyi CCMP1516]